MSVSKSLCIGDVVSRVFPNGTRVFLPETEGLKSLPSVPDFPPDLFAISAYLLEISGAYQYFVPHGQTGWPIQTVVRIAPRRVKELEIIGKNWSRSILIPGEVEKLWRRLDSLSGDTIFEDHSPTATAPDWWTVALELLVIADEACADVGYGMTVQHHGGNKRTTKPSWISQMVDVRWLTIFDKITKRYPSGNVHIRNLSSPSTICAKSDRDVVCVQPKSRTPNVGCTLRTLSHNLALLPPRGVVRTRWHRPPQELVHDDHSALNILLIPYPYNVSATWFDHHVCHRPNETRGPAGVSAWGWFELHQYWLNGPKDETGAAKDDERKRRIQALVDFTARLIERAKVDVEHLHGILFPEYALDWDAHDAITNMIKGRFPEIEFLVSGASTSCGNEHGNITLSTTFTRPQRKGRRPKSITLSTSRAKHHRWRLDEPQISTYALGSSLDPRVTWWEKIPLPKREIHVNVFRGSSTFATMICEDLARADPCHVVLRSMAPSLVFALLMDGPQMAERWSARYATVLADDPGSSVLTFTSLGLLERSIKAGRSDSKRFVALWKEDTGKTVPIPCEKGAHAIVLTLSGHRTTERTLDGRQNHDGRAWRFHGMQPIAVEPMNDDDKKMLKLVIG